MNPKSGDLFDDTRCIEQGEHVRSTRHTRTECSTERTTASGVTVTLTADEVGTLMAALAEQQARTTVVFPGDDGDEVMERHRKAADLASRLQRAVNA